MKKIAVIYHSAQGNTAHIANHVAAGARRVPGIEVHVLKAEDLAGTPDALVAFDGFLLGSPTYLGSVTGTFKNFMDATSGLWRSQKLKGKFAAAFTVSALPSGDKQSTLMSIFTFCMQHGMVWIGNPIMPEQHLGVPYEQAANRLGSWSGLMAQAGHSPGAESFAPGDIKTAEMFGQHFAETLRRQCGASEVA